MSAPITDDRITAARIMDGPITATPITDDRILIAAMTTAAMKAAIATITAPTTDATATITAASMDAAETAISTATAAAEATLAGRNFVSPVDILVGIGWLDPTTLERWRRGQVDCLEGAVQSNLPRTGKRV